MQPRFKGDSQLLLSLIELKDFKDIAGNLAGLVNKLRTLGFNKHKPLSPRRRDNFSPIGAATDTVAGGILLYNFAIRPLLSDIANLISDAQTTALQAQSDFMETGQIPHTAHYSEYLLQDYGFSMPPQFTDVAYGASAEVKYTASMERTYSYRPHNAFGAFMQYYGLGFTYETLWNLLPFSFLADYLLEISKSISAMEKDPNADPFVIAYYESVLRRSTWGAHVYHPNGFICFGGAKKDLLTPRFVSGYENSYYHRYPAAPNFGPALPKFAKYSDRKLLNSVALARVMF